MCVMLRIPAQWQHTGYRRKALDETRQLIASNYGDCVGHSKKRMVLDYLWRYPKSKEELEEELTSSRNWAGIDRNCEL